MDPLPAQPQHELTAQPLETINPPEISQEERQETPELQQTPQQIDVPADSQFLDIDPEIMRKLERIEQAKTQPQHTQQTSNNLKSLPLLPKVLSVEEQRVEEAEIKKEFVHKLKQWDREKEELRIRKQEIEQRRLKQKEELSLKRKQEEEEEREFLRLQKQKLIQQKIQEIEERRQRREESLKTLPLKRSYNQLPSYVQAEQKQKEAEKAVVELNLKILRDRKKMAEMDPEALRAHEQAYIQRIKERLNMVPRADRSEKAKSDFNLYLKRSEEKRQAEGGKVAKMKQYQQRINSIPIRIDHHKKEEKLIEIDKINNPQKYRLLSQKLHDQQIYEEFKNFAPNIDRKELGINYLNELKQAHTGNHTQKKRKVNSQLLKSNPEEKLPALNSKHEFAAKTVVKHEKTKSVQLFQSQAYKLSLDKNREKDSRYMKALRHKLSLAGDI